MWRRAVLRWKRTTHHPVEKLGNKVMSSLDWTVQVLVDGRISAVALMLPDGEGLGPPRPAASRRTNPNFSWGRHSSAWKEAKTLLKEGARLSKQSEQSLNTLVNGCTEHDDVARALNMLDVDTQEGIIKAAVKPLVHSSMKTSGSERDQPEEDEREETDEHSSE